ncbi:MAG: Crp/Fnr family transcriptional regulator [Ahrensia sp.]|nr:Crp/Fnr family transcriptional regulator [Ahrensia sp.]
MESLSQIALFKSLPCDVLEAQSRRCQWRRYEANELVIDYEDDSRDVRFIVSGSVRIILRFATGKEVILAEMKDNEFFGEIAAIDNEGRSANVTTLQRSTVCVMPQAVFLEMLEGEPGINRQVMRILAKRVRYLNQRLAEHCFLQTKHRLYTELLRMSRPRLGHEGQRSISPPPTQKDLAARIGTRREVVSREIAKLKRDTIVDKTTGALILTDLKRLNKLISDGWTEDM